MALPRWGTREEDRIVALIRDHQNPRALHQVHAHLLVNGQAQNNYLITKLARTLAELGNLQHARSIADRVSNPNGFLLTAMIRAYSKSDMCREALLMYTRMHARAVRPLAFTLTAVLKACAKISGLDHGLQVHAHVFKHGFCSETSVQTTMLEFYAKCGSISDAQKLFDKMPERDVQAWNTMIAGLSESGNVEAAISLFDRMPERNIHSWVEMISGCADSGRMEWARELFDMCGERNVVVSTCMMAGYGKCGDVVAARKLFDEMPERDVASWNAMIGVYSQAGYFDEAIEVFRVMIDRSRERPNQATIATVVSACTQSGSPELARWMEDYVKSRGGEMDVQTATAVIDMHAKCGNLDRAYEVFRGVKEKDAICYSAMIAGFAIHGRAAEALQLFSRLRGLGLKPDGICFIGVLNACSHAGLVDEGWGYFHQMWDNYAIHPTVDHYTCMVDILGRAGHIDDAYDLIIGGKVSAEVLSCASVWGALLNACRLHGRVEIGEIAAYRLFELEPENAANYVLMANMYAKDRRWGDVAKVRALMWDRGIRKPPGCSWIEVDGSVKRFLTGDVSGHPLLAKMVEELNQELQAQGNAPEPDFHDINVVENKDQLACFPTGS